MMIKIGRATAAQAEEILELANYVFSYSHRPHDFKKLVPKVYRDSYDFAPNHFILTEDNKIRAAILAHPSDVRVMDTVLHTIGIGSVSVHPYARGKGYMKQLLHYVHDELKKTAVDLIHLGGQRQRYAYFGYERGGCVVRMHLSADNVRHSCPTTDISTYRVVPVQRDDETLLAHIDGCVRQKTLCGVRPIESIFDIMTSFTGKLYAVLEGDLFVGYIIGRGEEIGVMDASKVLPMCKAFIETIHNDMEVCASVTDTAILAAIAPVSESIAFTPDAMYLPLHVEKCMVALLRLKASVQPLMDGELALDVEGERFVLAVHNGVVSSHPLQGEAHCTVTRQQAMTRWLSAEAVVLPFLAQDRLLNNWFPLPLHIPVVDLC